MMPLRDEFKENGAVCVRRALDANAMEAAERAFRWTLDNPGPNARDVLSGRKGAFYQDHAHPRAFEGYRPLLCETKLCRLVANIIGSDSLWFLYEQIWLKQGGDALPTPWHQDLPYVPMAGDHLATAWVNLDPVPKENSLELVRASHRGPLFNPTAFDPNDASAAMFAEGVWPALPDIEAARASYDIISWAIEPGDIVIFHPGMLHGGAPTRSGQRRRTISLRFFGDQAYCAERPETGLAEIDRLKHNQPDRHPIEQLARQPPGSLFRHPAFHKVA